MLVWDGGCQALDDAWYWLAENGIFDIPIVGNLVSAFINLFWGLFLCDFWE